MEYFSIKLKITIGNGNEVTVLRGIPLTNELETLTL